ncbi:GspE/PulE family protein [Paucibacter soli]|uniref:GspE/PulE family protein n=1 Tax=Paucibacter soli TaxID=3133433 RepID=UPI0030A1EE68
MTKLLGEVLLELGHIGASELEQALAYQVVHGGRVGAVLMRMGALSEEALFLALAEQAGLPLIRNDQLSEAEIESALAVSEYGRAWWWRQQALPWLDAEGGLHIATADPRNPDLLECLESGAQTKVSWHFAMPSDLERWQHRLEQQEPSGSAADARSLRELAEDAPVIAFVNNVIAQAAEARASDIHLEPGEREFQVRMRIDGVLHSRMSLPMSRYPAISSRIKLVSQLDIAERRLPQDGRTSIRVAGMDMDVRVSSIPAVHGESIVMRLLPKKRADLALERLGMADDHLAMFRDWLAWPNGLVLVTGPTGSGKSTTLYGALHAVNDLSRKIVTVEDPVEFRLPNIVQIQTQAEIGYTFARALRAILRHDPDIIMVGEIRDKETAEIAVQSALTGHLVLATLHTNDALSAITRLVDMGIEHYLVAAALRGVMAQRLVRRLCPECSIPIQPTASLEERWRARQSGQARAEWKQAVGCPSCQSTGFRGRVGIYELVQVDEAMQHLIAANSTANEVRALADAHGRRSLVDDGLLKVARGSTTFDEVLRASGGAAEA